MIRAPRLALFFLLALMQCLAPWVHAHTGAETGAFPHLPGLEFLAGPAKECAMANARPGGTDLIVGVQAGKWERADRFGFAPEIRVPPAWLPVPVPRLSGRAPVSAVPFSPFAYCRHDGCPRAPPLHSA